MRRAPPHIRRRFGWLGAALTAAGQIAIGKPGETPPSLGAARSYLSDDEWRAQVLEWMRRAGLVAVIAGARRWVSWELEQLTAQGRLDRLLLLFPPPVGDADADERRRRVRSALESGGSRELAAPNAWRATLQGQDLPQVIALFQGRAGRLVAVVSARPRRTDYETSLRLAVAELFPAGA